MDPSYLINKNGDIFNTRTKSLASKRQYSDGYYTNIRGQWIKTAALVLRTYVADYDWPIKFQGNDIYTTNLNDLSFKLVVCQETPDLFNINGELFKQGLDYNNLFISKTGAVYSNLKRRLLSINFKKGYKSISVPSKVRGRDSEFVHRLVYCVWNDIPLSECDVVHHIDCQKFNSNLDNLEMTTVLENTRRAIKDNLKYSAYTIEEIDQIASMYIAGKPFREIAIAIKCDESYYARIRAIIYLMKLGKAYKDIAEKYSILGMKIPSKNKLTEDQIIEIRNKLANGRTGNSVAKEYNIDTHTLYKIRDYQTWKGVMQSA